MNKRNETLSCFVCFFLLKLVNTHHQLSELTAEPLRSRWLLECAVKGLDVAVLRWLLKLFNGQPAVAGVFHAAFVNSVKCDASRGALG